MSWDIEYFRGKHCGTCANKGCDRSDKEVDGCMSDEMIRKADLAFMMGENE
jgi:hypothetical protein